ncbi:MAG: hypothetical protein QW291_09750 [Thermofilaceae archaeon]
MSVRLSNIAEVLKAFMLAGLVLGGIAFTLVREGGSGDSPAEGRLAEGVHSRSPRVTLPL